MPQTLEYNQEENSTTLEARNVTAVFTEMVTWFPYSFVCIIQFRWTLSFITPFFGYGDDGVCVCM